MSCSAATRITKPSASSPRSQRRYAKNQGFGDCAVLYRGNHQARLFEKALRAHDIPYFLSGGQSFFARTEVKDVMYLRLLANPDDDAAFVRIAAS